MKTLKCLSIMFWPMISLVVGLIAGLLIAVFTALLVFVITLVRTPMHIAKMMYVTGTTNVCFGGRYFCCFGTMMHRTTTTTTQQQHVSPLSLDPILRVVVFFLVPIPHLLWLVGVTFFCLFCGSLYYVNKATKTVYKQEYRDAYKKASSNIQLEKESHLGKYIKNCQNYMQDDEQSYHTIYFLKGLCSIIPGVILGFLPFLPFSLAVLAITLVRLPINIYQTMKVSYLTVTLKWDLKICALLMLPVIHILVFPMVVFVSALVGSYSFFAYSTSRSIFKGNSPFDKWGEFRTGLENYYNAHKQFVGEGYLGRYDHPTGIPNGWRGESYGLPIRQILKWQWDFFVCCVLLAVGFGICLVGSTLIFGVKLVPGIFSWWGNLCKSIAQSEMVEILGCWSLYLIGLALVPAGATLAAVIAILVGTVMSFQIPYKYLKGGCRKGLHAPFKILYEVDSWDLFDLHGFRFFACLREDPDWDFSGDHQPTPSSHSGSVVPASYWDRFATQCTRTTTGLMEQNWITLDQVRGMEPSVIQSIPAVAVLTILADTIHDGRTQGPQDISWKVDDTLCKAKDRPPLDRIASLLWPKVMQIKNLLQKNQTLSRDTNIKILTAMLCSNTDETTPELNSFLTSQDIDKSPNCKANKDLRTNLTDLTLILLRLKPFQDRMTAIFESNYGEACSNDANDDNEAKDIQTSLPDDKLDEFHHDVEVGSALTRSGVCDSEDMIGTAYDANQAHHIRIRSPVEHFDSVGVNDLPVAAGGESCEIAPVPDERFPRPVPEAMPEIVEQARGDADRDDAQEVSQSKDGVDREEEHAEA